jgi:hypothetical protein
MERKKLKTPVSKNIKKMFFYNLYFFLGPRQEKNAAKKLFFGSGLNEFLSFGALLA